MSRSSPNIIVPIAAVVFGSPSIPSCRSKPTGKKYIEKRYNCIGKFSWHPKMLMCDQFVAKWALAAILLGLVSASSSTLMLRDGHQQRRNLDSSVSLAWCSGLNCADSATSIDQTSWCSSNEGNCDYCNEQSEEVHGQEMKWCTATVQYPGFCSWNATCGLDVIMNGVSCWRKSRQRLDSKR